METLDKDTKYANKHKIQGRVLQKGRLMGIYDKCHSSRNLGEIIRLNLKQRASKMRQSPVVNYFLKAYVFDLFTC